MRQKYPNIPATIQITQDDLIVRMTIETEAGHREIVEQTLADDGLVVAKKMAPEVLLDNQLDVISLQHKLDMKDMELAHTQQILQIKMTDYQKLETRISTLEEQLLDAFKQQKDDARDSRQYLQRLATKLVNTSSKHNSEFTQIFGDLLARPDAEAAALQEALAMIQQTLEAIGERQEANEAERAALIEDVRALSEQSPTILRQLTDAVPNIGGGWPEG